MTSKGNGHSATWEFCGARLRGLRPSLIGCDGPDFENAPFRERMRGCDFYCLGHVMAIQHIKAEQRAVGVQERAFGYPELVVPDPDRDGLGVGGKSISGDPCASGIHGGYPLLYIAACRSRWRLNR